MFSEPYIKINFILLGGIIFIFAYSYLYPFLNPMQYAIPSHCKNLPEKYCKSKGLTRSFYELTKLNFEKARMLNKYSIEVFTFFSFQLIFRIFFSIIYVKERRVVNVDIFISTVYFVIVFYKLLPF